MIHEHQIGLQGLGRRKLATGKAVLMIAFRASVAQSDQIFTKNQGVYREGARCLHKQTSPAIRG